MANLFVPEFQLAKMAFTDLIPMLLGQSGVKFGGNNAAKNVKDFFKTRAKNVAQNVKDFFKTRAPSTNLIGQFQKFQESFQNLDFLLGTIRNPVVQLFLNPEAIRINKSVLYDKKQTRGGFVIQFWGHDLQTVEVNAATAYFQLSKEPLAAFELLKRQVYQSRFHPTQPFRGSPIIAMLFESQVLKGYFTEFNYELSSQQPFQFKYSFNFTVTENLTFVVGSNITNLAGDILNFARKGSVNIGRNRADTSIIPENLQFGRGWGVQLF